MGIPVENKEFAVEKRWTRILVDKRLSTLTATVTEEVGLYRDDGAWATLSTTEHTIDAEALLMLMELPLAALNLPKDQQTLGGVLNALGYGILTNQIPSGVILAPVVKDTAGKSLGKYSLLVLFEDGARSYFQPEQLPQTVRPRKGTKVCIQADGYLPQTFDLPYTLGAWKDEVVLSAIPVMPPSVVIEPATAAESIPAAEAATGVEDAIPAP